MFCENCGKPIDEGKLCADCAAIQPEEASFQLATPLEVTPEVPKAKEKKPRKKLGKKGKIILFSALALVLVIAAIIVICSWSHIRLFWKRTFTDPTDYMVAVEETAADRHAKTLAQAYGKLLSDLQTADRATHTELTLSVDDQIMSLLDQFLGGQIELGWVNDLGLTLDRTVLDGQSANQLGLNLNGTHLLDLEVFTSGEALWVQLPELSDDALTAPVGLGMPNLSSLPSAEAVEEMLRTFLAIPRTYMTDAQKGSETVKVGKLEQDLFVLSAELSEKAYKDLRIDLLTEAKTNTTLLQLVTALGGEEACAQFQAQLEESLSALSQEAASNKTALTYRVYLDKDDRIAGRSLELGDHTYRCFCLTGDGTWALSITADDLLVSGDGKVKDSKYSGDLTVKNGESTLLTMNLKDLEWSEESCSGTLSFQPGKKLLTAIGTELGLDETVMRLLGGSLSLDLTLDAKADSFDCRLSATAMGIALVEARLTSQETEFTPITLPEGGVDMTDADALTEWIKGLDFEPLLTGLEEAGMPSKYLLTLRLLLSQLG